MDKLSVLLIVSSTLTVSCSSSPDAEIQRGDAQIAVTNAFSTATDSQLQDVFAPVFGAVSPLAYATLFLADNDSLDFNCPSSTDTETGRVLIGDGCTTPSGTTYEGRVEFSNVFLFSDHFSDRTVLLEQPMELNFQGFSRTRAAGSTETFDSAIDGTLVRSSLSTSGTYRTEQHIDMTIDDKTMRVDFVSDCESLPDGHRACTIGDDAQIKVGDIEAFQPIGNYEVGPNFVSGTLTLENSEVVDLELASSFEGCAIFSIDMSARDTYCPHEPDSLVQYQSLINGLAIDSNRFFSTILRRQGANFDKVVLEFALPNSVKREVHEAYYTTAGQSSPRWEVEVGLAGDNEYLPGQTSAMATADVFFLRFTAYDAAGRVACIETVSGEGDNKTSPFFSDSCGSLSVTKPFGY